MKTLQELKNHFEVDKNVCAKIFGGDVIRNIRNNEDEGDMA